MPGAKPLVQGQRSVGIIHLEVLVVEVMRIGVGVDGSLFPGLDLVEADMADHGPGPPDLQVVENQKWM